MWRSEGDGLDGDAIGGVPARIERLDDERGELPGQGFRYAGQILLLAVTQLGSCMQVKRHGLVPGAILMLNLQDHFQVAHEYLGRYSTSVRLKGPPGMTRRS